MTSGETRQRAKRDACVLKQLKRREAAVMPVPTRVARSVAGLLVNV